MRKFFHWFILLTVLLLLGLGGYSVWSWFALDDLPQPKPQITIAAQELTSNQTQWTVPLWAAYLGGIFTGKMSSRRAFGWKLRTLR